MAGAVAERLLQRDAHEPVGPGQQPLGRKRGRKMYLSSACRPCSSAPPARVAARKLKRWWRRARHQVRAKDHQLWAGALEALVQLGEDQEVVSLGEELALSTR